MAKAIQSHCTTEVWLVTVGVQPDRCLTVLQSQPQRLCNPSLMAYNLCDKSFPAHALKQLQDMAKSPNWQAALSSPCSYRTQRHYKRHELPGWQILVHAICTVISENCILTSSYIRPPLPSCKPRGTAPMCGVHALLTADPHLKRPPGIALPLAAEKSLCAVRINQCTVWRSNQSSRIMPHGCCMIIVKVCTVASSLCHLCTFRKRCRAVRHTCSVACATSPACSACFRVPQPTTRLLVKVLILVFDLCICKLFLGVLAVTIPLV